MRYQTRAGAVLAAASLACALPAAARAQPTDPTSTAPEAAVAPEADEPGEAGAPCCLVPARTPVAIEIVDAINSRRVRSGETFRLRLVEPLVVDGVTVVPAGATGAGEIVHAARARAMGKAGELILAARWIEHDGRRIPLRSMRFGSDGQDNSQAALITSTVAGALLPGGAVIGFLIAGGEVDVPAGTRARALLAEEQRLPPAQAPES